VKRFVVVVDTQWDFMAVDGALSVAGAADLIDPMRAWLAALTSQNTAGVLFTYDTHQTEVYASSPEAELFAPHCVKGTAGWHNMLDAGTLDPAIPTWTIEKGVFDMWAEDHLKIADARNPQANRVDREVFFAKLKADGVNVTTVVGVAADYCVRWAVEGLVARGFEVEVPASLTRGIERQIEAVVAEEFGTAPVTILP
jgi:nicotinamidase/pyrazinamidase